MTYSFEAGLQTGTWGAMERVWRRTVQSASNSRTSRRRRGVRTDRRGVGIIRSNALPWYRVSGKRLNREIGYGNFPARTAFSQRSKIVRTPCKNHSVSHASPLHTISASNFSFISPGSGDTSGWFLSGQFKRFIQTRYYLNLELQHTAPVGIPCESTWYAAYSSALSLLKQMAQHWFWNTAKDIIFLLWRHNNKKGSVWLAVLW